MGNSGLCCGGEDSNSNKANELTTERLMSNNTTQGTSRSRGVASNTQGKILTLPADENSIPGSQSNNKFKVQNFSSQNKLSATVYENEDQMNERVNYLKSIVDKAPKLDLEIINSSVLPQGIVMKINAMGLESSLRRKNDGYTFFGYQENITQPFVDYIIRPTEPEPDSRYFGRHFQIYFNSDSMKYYIRDLGNGFGTFVKIQNEIMLKDNTLINLGDSYLVCTMGSDQEGEESEYSEYKKREFQNLLNIKVFSGNTQYDPMNFLPTKSAIKVGRANDCEIAIEDGMLSRVHCTIEFRENFGWIIRDGFLSRNRNEHKTSTNGTWIYAMDDIMIYEGLVFKANHNLFQCHYA